MASLMCLMTLPIGDDGQFSRADRFNGYEDGVDSEAFYQLPAEVAEVVEPSVRKTKSHRKDRPALVDKKERRARAKSDRNERLALRDKRLALVGRKQERAQAETNRRDKKLTPQDVRQGTALFNRGDRESAIAAAELPVIEENYVVDDITLVGYRDVTDLVKRAREYREGGVVSEDYSSSFAFGIAHEEPPVRNAAILRNKESGLDRSEWLDLDDDHKRVSAEARRRQRRLMPKDQRQGTAIFNDKARWVEESRIQMAEKPSDGVPAAYRDIVGELTQSAEEYYQSGVTQTEGSMPNRIDARITGPEVLEQLEFQR